MRFPEKPKPITAVIFLGNMGAGKSTLLSQIGGKFPSGITFMTGFTKDVTEQIVELDGERVILMDTPGLYEPSEEATIANAKKLTDALTRGYDYKIFIVLKASNRGVTPQDLALMSKVNKSVRRTNGAKIEYRVIINQIEDDEMYNMYEEQVVRDNFEKVFRDLDSKYELDLKINGVMLVRSGKDAVDKMRYREPLAAHIKAQPSVHVKTKEIETKNKDIDLYLGLCCFVLGMTMGASLAVRNKEVALLALELAKKLLLAK